MLGSASVRLLALACALARVAPAHAEPTDRIVVAGRDAALGTALGDALAPQQVTAVEDAPPVSIGELAAASRRLVEREHAGSAIWLITDGGITTLVAYDRQVDRVLVRTIPYVPPLDDAQAAITARSARAMLRALTVDEATVERPRAVAAASVADTTTVPDAPPRIASTAGVGVRFGAPGRGAGIGELMLGAVWRPAQLGVAVELALALAPDIAHASFEGTVGDRSLAALARWPLRLTASSSVVLDGGLAIHAVRFAGVTSSRTIADWRFDPATRLGAAASYVLRDGVATRLSLSADYLLRRQRYEVEGETVLVVPPVQLAVGVSLVIQIR